MAKGILIKRFMYENGVTVMGYLCRIHHVQYILWVREWFQNEPEGIFMGASLSIHNGGIFNYDDIPIEFRSILEGQYELTSSCGEDWVSFSHISVILDKNPHGHLFTLLLTERPMLLRPLEDSREDMDLMAPYKMGALLMRIIHCLVMSSVV